MSPFLLLALFFGGESSLSGYVNPEQYWATRGVAYEVEALTGFLMEEEGADPEEIGQWVKKLGANDFDEREAASAALAEIGDAAESLLIEASKEPDPEVARRAKLLLQEMQKNRETKDPLDEWMAMYSLSKMEDPAAATALKTVSTDAREDLRIQALEWLSEKETATDPASASDALAGFPEETKILLQMRPSTNRGGVLKRIHHSPAIQNQFVKILTLMGDIRIHRITIGINDGVFYQKNPRGLVRVEMDYNSERLKTALEKGRFQKSSLGEMEVFHRHGMGIALVDERQLALLLPYRGGENEEDALLTTFAGKDAPMLLSKSLLAAMNDVPESSLFRGAGEFSEEMMKNLEDFSVVRGARLQVLEGGERLNLNLELTTTDEGAATGFHAYAVEEKAKIIELLRNEGDDGIELMVTALNTVTFAQAGERVILEGQLTNEGIAGAVDLVEQMMQRVQMIQERHRQRIQDMEIQRQDPFVH